MADYATPSPDATPSPAETLRRAAARMRADWPPCVCAECAEESHADRDFHVAVADWLDFVARIWDGFQTEPSPTNNALVVARAYLGESA